MGTTRADCKGDAKRNNHAKCRICMPLERLDEGLDNGQRRKTSPNDDVRRQSATTVSLVREMSFLSAIPHTQRNRPTPFIVMPGKQRRSMAAPWLS